MISRNLWHRLKQLEDKIKPRCEPQATPKQLQLIQRLDEARRRIALEDGKTYVEYSRPLGGARRGSAPGIWRRCCRRLPEPAPRNG